MQVKPLIFGIFALSFILNNCGNETVNPQIPQGLLEKDLNSIISRNDNGGTEQENDNGGTEQRPEEDVIVESPWVPGDKSTLRPNEIEVIRLMNQYRASRNIRICTITAYLNNSARQNSLIQETRRYSGHFTNRGAGVAEIAYYGPTTPQGAIAGWKASAGHNRLMLTNYAKCGVNMGTRGNSWTINFSN